MKNNKSILLLASIFAAFVFFSCRSTQVESGITVSDEKKINVDSRDKVFCIYDNADFIKNPDDGKYIFIRLYQPSYDNPFCVENILKNCIGSIDVNKEVVSHSAIAFSLNDAYYGLTSTDSKKNLTVESCTTTTGNKYMKKCNQYRSVEITYALKVSESEYENVKKSVEEYYNSGHTKYDVMQNVRIAGQGIKRKLFMTKAEKQFACHADKNPDATFEKERHDFVCSTFIAYILANNVESIHSFFVENKIDSNYVMPSDLAYLPGIVKLFKTTWIDYNVAARYCAESYSCFKTYYTEYIVSEK